MPLPSAGQIQPTPETTKATPASTDRQVGFSDRPVWVSQYGAPARKGVVIDEHRTHNGEGRLMYSVHYEDGGPDMCVFATEVFLNESDANKAGFV